MILKIFTRYFIFLFVASFTILFQKFPYNLDEDFLVYFQLFERCTLDVVGFSVCSGAGSGVKILFRFFIENIQLLKSLRTFSLVTKSNIALF